MTPIIFCDYYLLLIATGEDDEVDGEGVAVDVLRACCSRGVITADKRVRVQNETVVN